MATFVIRGNYSGAPSATIEARTAKAAWGQFSRRQSAYGQRPHRTKFVVKKAARNPSIKLPATWTNAKVRVNPKGQVQIHINPAKTLNGRTVKNVVKVERNSSKRRKR